MDRREEPALDEMARQVRAVIRTEHARGLRGYATWAAAAVVAAALLAWWLWPGEETVRWQTHTVDRGDMVLTATATGNLEPKSEVTVGAEISGRIAEVMVDENDVVEAGDILALFDTEELRVALEQALARLALARASVEENEATLEETLLDERRNQSIVERGSGSQAELDRARAARKRASANLTYARAAVREAEAAVSAARTRLSKALISSPIDGVVLQRNIEPGNAIAASFQTPELFLLAEDLSDMELHVSLDEADVGLVEPGQTAAFTVDAWPNRDFDAVVLKVFLYPTVEDNVVTYTAVLSVDNSDGQLRPGMTATATLKTGTREQVLRVPNGALRFEPPGEEGGGGIMLGPPGMRAARETVAGNSVWVLRGGEPRRLLLRTGRTDGRYTEVLSDELEEGDEVLVGVLSGKAGVQVGS
jgi:HlyD family secretion protein